MNTIVVLTALPLEQHAVLKRLTDIETQEHQESKTQYKVGKYSSNGNVLNIIVGRTNQTNVNAGIETERIIQHYKPTHIFFVGVAGGLKDVKIGDIVIGSEVYGYERGKAKDVYLPRPKFAFSSYELEMKALDFSNDFKWQLYSTNNVDKRFHESIKVFSGAIATGEKVISSVESDLFKFIKSNASHALAVDMEGLGFLEACRPYPLIKTLLLRGISDLIDNKEGADDLGSQEYAAKNVADFLFGFIDYLNIPQSAAISTTRQRLLDIVTKLYPEGLKDKGLWLRAGGDLSLVSLYTTGKAQWVDALKLVENGGGGDIDFLSIVREIKKDSPRLSLEGLDL